jgi:IstB-like ATP binding protein
VTKQPSSSTPPISTYYAEADLRWPSRHCVTRRAKSAAAPRPGPRSSRLAAHASNGDLRQLPKRTTRGTVTLLSIGLGLRACQVGHRVAFATAAELVARLADAHHAGTLQVELVKLGRIPLIVVDEVGRNVPSMPRPRRASARDGAPGQAQTAAIAIVPSSGPRENAPDRTAFEPAIRSERGAACRACAAS